LTATCSPEATSYAWSTNAGFAGTAKSGTVSPTKPTVYTLIGSNAAGEKGTQATAAVYVCNTPPSEVYPGVVVVGTAGNEQISDGIGSDTIDGGPGFDTVIYNCNRDSFTLVRTTVGWSISSTAEGIDTLANVERIRFGDKTLALDISGNAGQAYRLYRAAFNRVPDNAGLKYWISVLDNGTSLKEVAAGFMGSDEFKILYGVNPTNEAFVTSVYTNVLQRAPDSAGYAYWVNALNQKTLTQMDVLMLLSESPENQSGVIGSILNGIELLN
jgi:serralysin